MLVLRDGGQPTSAICGRATLRATREGSGGDGGERVRLRTTALAETGRRLPLRAPREGSGGVLRTRALADAGACPTSRAADAGPCGERRRLADAGACGRSRGGEAETAGCASDTENRGGRFRIGLAHE
ncbi:hypothetical protein K438DRAFT_1817533, partial [Mycena galopus ATCC 62051]